MHQDDDAPAAAAAAAGTNNNSANYFQIMTFDMFIKSQPETLKLFDNSPQLPPLDSNLQEHQW